MEKIQIQQELDRHKTEVDRELGRQCLRQPWGKQAVRLLQLPGFGVVMTMIVLSASGRKERRWALVEAAWQVLTKEGTDLHTSEEDLAYKMLVLSWDLEESARMGLTYKQFAKYALMKLGIETDIIRFMRRNVPRRIAPRAEVLVRMEELGPSA